MKKRTRIVPRPIDRQVVLAAAYAIILAALRRRMEEKYAR
jgi:hypothetical protein